MTPPTPPSPQSSLPVAREDFRQRLSRFAQAKPRQAAFIGLALRGWLVWVWATSGLAKLNAFDDFQRSVYDYQLLSVPMATAFSYVVPGLELVVALYLLLGWYLRPAAWGSAVILIVFCAAIGWALSQGLQIDCGCMIGGQSEPIGWPKLLSNGALIGASLLLAVWPRHVWTVDRAKLSV